MHERVANLLGAAALAVTDRVLAGARANAGVSASGAAALVVASTGHELSVTELGRRIGLSQSAAARMVDSLEGKRLLERRPRHGREVAVGLTDEGHRVARGLLDARGTGLESLLDALSPAEQKQLGDLLSTLLTRIHQDVGNADLLCRLCDRASCTTDAVCPVGQAQRDGPG
ncbi:MarR family transcriptional regulator [Prauserella marina]|uniref:DNA-binding transcriptional regulator, MarR family n=1 Tax=Prauserella marina TaxID=530584 RepID=A0A222VTK0_9PSEU|nr:MarR family transcriptional regulator [Prauserella marina]ASR37257.1 MarR family transcriptional regulator [Prauserella marina]PWV72587.1 DNA-binding MarR family transcriptional regulator [Prauserella marina]SDD76540.1 DNA-binding transcriptional regulator, MarR family [Prauserella marina]